MNPELLKKCLSGEASNAEMRAYHHWLEGSTEEEFDKEYEIEAEVEQRLWTHIKDENAQFELNRFRKRWLGRIAVAATLVIGLFCLGLYSVDKRDSTKEMAVKHDGNEIFQEKTFQGLRFRLGNDSEALLKNAADDRVAIHFSGNMMLSNKSAYDQYTEISYTMPDGKQTKKEVNLRKGHTYFLAYYPFKSENLMIVEERDLMNMPPALALNITNDFNYL
ncbi:hypothetical protein [Pedobacter sp. MC2016-24]|uniref:hypothetical protein n=1 Tax=Pedobacter sp. MC2016-24 TaxID=2780090 RepID=UPI0018809072|nr:hypothetical protein [Pedobacter sp. MC2016-24]MBE9602566.1 hypothetical protein [Pedobacter sp. MC2016-24]